MKTVWLTALFQQHCGANRKAGSVDADYGNRSWIKLGVGQINGGTYTTAMCY